MNYWLWMGGREKDSDAYIQGVPDIVEHNNISFDDGELVSISNLLPIKLTLNNDYVGRITDELEATGTTGILIHSKIKELLDGLEVNNLQYFETEIKDILQGKIYTDWFLVNIVGNIKCVDMQLSKLVMDDNEIEFIDKLVLDVETENKSNLKIFRLTEYLPLIVVNDEVKQAIEKSGFTGPAFIAPSKLVL